MLNYQACNLYQLTNTTASELFGIPAGGSKIVLANPAYMIAHDISSGLFQAIGAETITVQNILGAPVASSRAASFYSYLASQVQTWHDALRDAEGYISAVYGKSVRLHWNLSAQHVLMDTIGADVLSADLGSLGLTKASVVAKMEPSYALVMQGMFAEAAEAAGSIATDAFLTPAKIAQYQAIINGADAFQVVL